MTLYADMTMGDALDEAFENIGFSPEAVQAAHIDSARRSIRRLLTVWNNDAINFWKVAPGLTHTQTVGEDAFPLPAGTIDLISIGILRNGYLTPVLMISQSDWFNIADKGLASGLATRVWVERDVEPPIVHVYPKAENSTDVLVFDAMQWFEDSSALNVKPNIGQMWNDAFISALEWYLAQKHAPARAQEKEARYGGPETQFRGNAGSYRVARMGNRERADTVMIRRTTRSWRRGR